MQNPAIKYEHPCRNINSIFLPRVSLGVISEEEGQNQENNLSSKSNHLKKATVDATSAAMGPSSTRHVKH